MRTSLYCQPERQCHRSEILEIADRFLSSRGTQPAPSVQGNGITDEPDRAVTHRDLDATGMTTTGRMRFRTGRRNDVCTSRRVRPPHHGRAENPNNLEYEPTMKKLDSLKTLFVHELKDLLNAERQILKALPKMAKGAKSPELKAAFTEHQAQTETQVDRLERILESLGESNRGAQNQSIDPSSATSAAVCRSPMSPWSAMGG